MVDKTTECAAGGINATNPDELIRIFAYDALYRLVYATGREAGSHLASSDPNFKPTPDTSAGGTVAYYREYSYDKLGNMLDLYHHGGMGNQFHRVFNSASSNPFELSNLATDIEYAGTVVNYSFDANGNMLTEGAGRSFEWDYGDRMRGFSEGTTTAAYFYDAGGNRVKKVVRKSASLKEVTVYIDGGFEYIYTLDGTNTVVDEWSEIHVMDGRSRVARIKVEDGIADEVKYNLEDHLGNASFTMNGAGSLINREEYFPFGETSFGSYAIKRYRYNGKERDEESGLYYYGARYYAPWCGRFVSVDPMAGSMPFVTPYSYAANNPIVMVDKDGLAPGRTDEGGQPEKQKPNGGNVAPQQPGPNPSSGNVTPQQPGPNPSSGMSPFAGEYNFKAPKVDFNVVGMQPIDIALGKDTRDIKRLNPESTNPNFSGVMTLVEPAAVGAGAAESVTAGEAAGEAIIDYGIQHGPYFGAKVVGLTVAFTVYPQSSSTNDMTNTGIDSYVKTELKKREDAETSAKEYEKNPKKYGEEPTWVYTLKSNLDQNVPCRNCFDATVVRVLPGEILKIGITNKQSMAERYSSPPSYFPNLLKYTTPTIIGPFPRNIAMAIEKRAIIAYGFSQESKNVQARNGMQLPLMRPPLNAIIR